MQGTTDSDFFRIPRPRGILRWLLGLLQLRSERMRERDRGDTIMSVATVLSHCGRDGTVISRQRHDEWSVTLGPIASSNSTLENR